MTTAGRIGLVDGAEQLLDLVRARGLRVGEVAASLGRGGREPGEVGLGDAELAQARRPRERGELLDAAGGIVGSADRLAEARDGVRSEARR